MSDDTRAILCGKCSVAIEGPTNPKPDDAFACPKCGRGASFEDVMASAKAFATEAAGRHFQEGIRKSLRGNKGVKLQAKPIKQGDYPFIVDIDL